MQIYYRRVTSQIQAAFSPNGPVSDEALERVRTMLGIHYLILSVFMFVL
ncbi:hypothetical protein Goshw_002748 [Gossypium schwendimanii]|uniref:Uncharacterized protein n=1 Tax=Gossypium schwendimanii TaxID=34291 RepID=A0A7J9MLV3_GOSSC|nr:hypothetical protein [Gossypium schwendimanii]